MIEYFTKIVTAYSNMSWRGVLAKFLLIRIAIASLKAVQLCVWLLFNSRTEDFQTLDVNTASVKS